MRVAARRLILTMVPALMWTTGLHAQPLPASPVPVLPPSAPPAAPPVGLGPPVADAPPPIIAPPPATPPGVVPVDPARNGWGPYGAASSPASIFVDAEIEFLGPAVKNRLFNTVPSPDGSGGTDTVHAPSVDLPWTASPKIEVGYRLPDCVGAFAVSYRFLATQATTNITIDGTGFTNESRLNVNIFDFDYITPQYEFVPRWEQQFRIGIRMANFFYDSRFFNSDFFQKTSNNYLGAGPHASIDLTRRIVVLPGLSFFTTLDGAVLIGQIRQHFNEQLVDAFGNTVAAETPVRGQQAVPGLNLQAGLSYTPPSMESFHVRVGYQFERYWDVGRLNGSNLELTTQGAFLRGELDF
jgi:hypothetical protein